MSTKNESSNNKLPPLVETIDLSFQADGNLREATTTTTQDETTRKILVPSGNVYSCSIPKTTHDLGSLCCYYAKSHGLDVSQLRFHTKSSVGFQFCWTLEPHTVNLGEKDVDKMDGATILVTQQPLSSDHVQLWIRAGESLVATTHTSSSNEDNTQNDDGLMMLRVKEGTLYPCLMLWNQRFSGLFKYYAKMHGLNQEDLEYRFNSVVLEGNETPKMRHFQMDDTVVVQLKRKRPREEKDDT